VRPQECHREEALLKPDLKPKRKSKTQRRFKPSLERNLEKAYPADRKERGEWVELLFMATAARLGLKVARPHGDSARFDVIVEGGGKLHRVQVKSTTQKRRDDYQCRCSWSSTTPGLKTARDSNAARPVRRPQAQQYSKEDIDFVAAYVVPEDAWFIIPTSDLPTKVMYLPPRKRAERSRYGSFLEAWPLLGADGSKLTIQASVESDLLLALIKAKVTEECSRR